MNTSLELDPEDFRARINDAINQYNDAIADLVANKPEIDPASFGEGFVGHGEALAASVDAVYERTLDRLRSRVEQYKSMLTMAEDVSSTDGTTAGELNTHG
ncbi:hypothetical protein [Corynebacterium tuscaniense]|uniref:hypothetical protein n=1 Tax=Corynebacterium tuscaniense TaxID=302449 RepID=UPI001238878A|nr:hypothetical protein [Corynebacterium tuscaniense]KAA8734627.1 hypothetical protein F4V54_08525 [Corynebacterium tuscaniense]